MAVQSPTPDRASHHAILVATRKGAWILHDRGGRTDWQLDGPHFLGHVISHMVLDPRDGRTLLAGARTGHLGPTVFRSADGGQRWQEAARPPAFARAGDDSGRAVDQVFWLTPGPACEPGVWYAGTSPQGLFRSEDGGDTWSPYSCLNDDPDFRRWMGSVQDGTPDGPKLHSVIIDPRDPRHLYIAMSGGGVHESVDGGASFTPLLDGLEVVEGFDVGDPTFHDPHCIRLCPGNPDRLYQQNHCGIYRLDRPGRRWVRIGRAMPADAGDVGFPLVVHPRDDRCAWVFPMDASSV
ncbi:MAG: glycosyl hydrolase, partial [Rhodocyclaceae bacterium]|nr:glycosyl hydrolase [Rhodocyclaceae bacterium]